MFAAAHHIIQFTFVRMWDIFPALLPWDTGIMDKIMEITLPSWPVSQCLPVIGAQTHT